jgi:hypothetical protein
MRSGASARIGAAASTAATTLAAGNQFGRRLMKPSAAMPAFSQNRCPQKRLPFACISISLKVTRR